MATMILKKNFDKAENVLVREGEREGEETMKKCCPKWLSNAWTFCLQINMKFKVSNLPLSKQAVGEKWDGRRRRV